MMSIFQTRGIQHASAAVFLRVMRKEGGELPELKLLRYTYNLLGSSTR